MSPLRVLRRHAWSLPLSVLSALAFFHLASEMREGELGPFDQAAAGVIAAWRGRLDGLMFLLTRAGGFEGMTITCVLGVSVLFGLGKRKDAWFVLVCGAGALLLCTLLKLLLHRARPGATIHYLIQAPSSFSFPSGHAMASMSVIASLVVVAHALRLPQPWRLAASGLALLFVVGVAVSRVYFGVHFPSDVIGGDLAGAAWVAAVTGWVYPRLLPGEVSGTSAP